MIKYKTLILSILFLVIFHFGVSKALAFDILRYSLCKNNISKAVVSSYCDSHAVNIQLTPSATKEFSKLTKENIGQRLEILFKEKVILSATIMANIKSGQIQLKVTSEREANKLLKDILNYAPKQPCGLLSQ